MSSKSKAPVALVALAVSLACLASVFSATDAAADWTDIPQDQVVDMGEMWGYTCAFVYNGQHAEAVEWDFGDGSPRSTEWNTQHTYAEIGEYIAVQHATNSFQGGSEDWGYYLVRIMGNPYVEFVSPDGSPVMEKVYFKKGQAPERPSDPSWEGHEFLGFFQDEARTVPFDWTVPQDTPAKAYVSYTNPTPDPNPDPEPKHAINGIEVALTVFAAILLIASAATRRPALAIVALAILAIVAMVVFGVFEIPDFWKKVAS